MLALLTEWGGSIQDAFTDILKHVLSGEVVVYVKMISVPYLGAYIILKILCSTQIECHSFLLNIFTYTYVSPWAGMWQE